MFVKTVVTYVRSLLRKGEAAWFLPQLLISPYCLIAHASQLQGIQNIYETGSRMLAMRQICAMRRFYAACAQVRPFMRLSVCPFVCPSACLSLWRASFAFCHSLSVSVSRYASLALPLALFVVCALCVRTFNCNWILITALSAKNVAVARLADRADRADRWTDGQAEWDRQSEKAQPAATGSNS